MKRLIPLLMILAFSCDLSDGRVNRLVPDHTHFCEESGISNSHQCTVKLSNKWHRFPKQQLLPVDYLYFIKLKPSLGGHSFSVSPPLASASKHYHWLGLGCGALPS
jgi:hypothetical protein